MDKTYNEIQDAFEERVEIKLTEADEEARNSTLRLTHDEVFKNIKKTIYSH